MNYPRYDFRSKLLSGVTGLELVKSLVLEPWTELIRIWNRLGRPGNLYPEFCEAIRYNIANERYNPLGLFNVTDYPEFNKAVLYGLLEAWLRYPLRYQPEPDDGGLFIGKIPANINLSFEDRIHIIEHIRCSGKCQIRSGSQVVETGIWMTRSVRQAYHLINLLS